MPKPWYQNLWELWIAPLILIGLCILSGIVVVRAFLSI